MRIPILKGILITAIVCGGSLGAYGSPGSGAGTDAEIRRLLDNWAMAFHDRNIDAIMTMYRAGEDFVSFDLVPPLQYVGYAAYKKDYQSFLAQYKGPINVEYRDLHIASGDTVAYGFGLEHFDGMLTDGHRSSMWLRFTSIFRKIGGRWYDVHDHISVPADLDSGKALTNLVP